jgi:hypothetical protein
MNKRFKAPNGYRILKPDEIIMATDYGTAHRNNTRILPTGKNNGQYGGYITAAALGATYAMVKYTNLFWIRKSN